jgi:biopolymer transport protein ExbB
LVPAKVIREAHDALSEDDTIRLSVVIADRSDLLSTMLRAGIAKAGNPPELIEKAMEGSLSTELARIRNRIRRLGDLGNLAPMVGLLGTVWGMIWVFKAVSMDTSAMVGNWSGTLAGGVSQAMVTTVVGLLIGIPSLFFYYTFRNILSRVLGHLESLGTEMAILFSKETPKHPTVFGEGEKVG